MTIEQYSSSQQIDCSTVMQSVETGSAGHLSGSGHSYTHIQYTHKHTSHHWQKIYWDNLLCIFNIHNIIFMKNNIFKYIVLDNMFDLS